MNGISGGAGDIGYEAPVFAEQYIQK